ncbi:MAG: exodeoxyribonuclease VII large subunit [Rickettsiales bacterium]|jgi:exodeoxyribonuclease VII large subunit
MTETQPDFNHNQIIYSVSEVAQSIKRMVEDRFGRVSLRGEISGWKVASSGHVYFRLKDDSAVIDSVSWKGTVGKFTFKPEDGLEVVVTGKLTTYPGKSSYQIVVDSMQPAGAGALMALLEKRRKALEAEGLFAPERKKKIPFMPQVVGVITSPTGAVIRDILHRISERFPVQVLVFPVAVQGEAAAEQIAAAIDFFNSLNPDSQIPIPDLLIVARGGGSIEDLWAFNEEIVVRAAANSRIPLISAVGHETDTTLIDYASDMRAPTPTAAAEMAVPVREELRLAVGQLGLRHDTAIFRLITQRSEQLEGLARGLPKPVQLLQTATQRLDDLGERLLVALPNLLVRKEQQLAMLTAHLRPQALQIEIRNKQERLLELQSRLELAVLRVIEARGEKLKNLTSLLESVNYKKILARGFALVKGADGKLITTASEAKAHESLTVIFADGEIIAKL